MGIIILLVVAAAIGLGLVFFMSKKKGSTPASPTAVNPSAPAGPAPMPGPEAPNGGPSTGPVPGPQQSPVPPTDQQPPVNQ